MTFEEWQAIGAANGWDMGGIQETSTFDDLSKAPPAVQEAFARAAQQNPVFPINPDCTHPNAFPVGEQVSEGVTEKVVRCIECSTGDWLESND